MAEDIVPELLDAIQKDFRRNLKNSNTIQRVQKLLDGGTATYKDANDFAQETGEILADVFKRHLSADVLPDGRMYFNIADRILNETLGESHGLVSAIARQVQNEMNHAAGIGIKALEISLNQDRISGFVNRLAAEPDFNKIAWILDEPIINFNQAIIDENIKANAGFHAEAGLSPVIHRIAASTCCDWCDEIAGYHKYHDVPEDVYRRHERCRCTVEYDPKQGKRQNVWTKRWS